MQRRDLLKSAAALAAAGLPGPALFAAEADKLKPLGAPQAFDYAWLKGQARSMAGVAYIAPSTDLPEKVKAMDWDQYQAINFRKDHSLWRKDDLQFEARFFHLGLFFKSAVKMYEVVDGQAQLLAYDPQMFDYGKSGLKGVKLPKDLGFAGFRINYHTDLDRDVAAFLGASYFRAVGSDWQYGLSARGLAIDTGLDRPEEFPVFTAFWLEKPAKGANSLVVYALLDSPSVAGAYRFEITPGKTLTMDVDAALYPRRAIERLGIAPGTTMYQVGENDHRMANDFRPEIHDSDGLSLWTGTGEWIWRPLTNPPTIHTNSYFDSNPKGFGLLQRDRNFDHYQDDGVFYEKRPSLWVEPKGNWGKGAVQLVEIPTVDETFDNIVAYWNPAEKPQPGQELLYAYRLSWGREMPHVPTLATVVATRTGLGGVIGQKRKYYSWRFVVDFVGGDLGLLGKDAKVEAVVVASRGSIELVSARPQAEINGWRATFDVKPDDSIEPIDIRMYLKLDGQPLSETWLYQWTPPAVSDRRLY